MSNNHLVCEEREKVSAFSLFCPKTSMKLNYFQNLCVKSIFRLMKKDINRLKLVLVEKKKTGKWLAEQIGKDPSTVSKWCSNKSQPSLEDLFRIAELLEVNYTELIRDIS